MSVETWADRLQKRYMHRIYRALDGKPFGARWIYTDAEMRTMGYPWGGDPVARWVNWYVEHGGITLCGFGGFGALAGWWTGRPLLGWALGATAGVIFYRCREWYYGTLGTRDGQMDWRAPARLSLVPWALWAATAWGLL